jgi:hypothetical protein
MMSAVIVQGCFHAHGNSLFFFPGPAAPSSGEADPRRRKALSLKKLSR